MAKIFLLFKLFIFNLNSYKIIIALILLTGVMLPMHAEAGEKRICFVLTDLCHRQEEQVFTNDQVIY